MRKNRCAAVIVAAGTGTRMGAPVPKQFIEIKGKPLLAYTLDVFERSDVTEDIVIVTGSDYKDHVSEEIVRKYGFRKVCAVVPGGETRCCSVFNGLAACPEKTDYVFIHDAVRSMITNDILERGLAEVLQYGSAVASVASVDTVRIADEEGNVVLTPDRKNVRCIQTPQIFSFPMLYKAYREMTKDQMRTFTDDAMVWEHYCAEKLHLYEGSRDNIKITTPEDLVLAERILSGK